MSDLSEDATQISPFVLAAAAAGVVVAVGGLTIGLCCVKRQQDDELDGDEEDGDRYGFSNDRSLTVPGGELDEVEDDLSEDDETEDDLIAKGERALEQAKLFFPNFDLLSAGELFRWRTVTGRVYICNAESPVDYVQEKVIEHVENMLKKLDEPSFESLMKSENAKKLCLHLGMNPIVVDIKFLALESFQKKFGFQFQKCPIIDSIAHLISQLGYTNPFGTVSDDNTIEDYNMKRGELTSLRYLGVSVTPRDKESVIESIKDILKVESLDDCFMHGTTASTLEHFVEKAELRASKELRKHDFGPGLYCFKGKLEAAFMYAFHRSWPHPSQNSRKKIAVAKISKDNPSVAVFCRKNLGIPKKDMFHVGHTPYPERELENYANDLQSRKKLYRNMLKNELEWKCAGEERNWKHFLKASHYIGFVPESKPVFHGVVHGSDQIVGTGKCREPTPDKDSWIQYCFPKPSRLGDDLLFIELHLDWCQWLPNPVDAEESDSVCKATLDFLESLAGGKYAGESTNDNKSSRQSKNQKRGRY